MNQQPDKLFRENLQGYQVPVPPEAWKRISANLQKPSSKKVWLKIAAALLVLALAAVFLTVVDEHEAKNIARKVEMPAKEPSKHPASAVTDPSGEQDQSLATRESRAVIKTIPGRKTPPSPPEKQAVHSAEPPVNTATDARAEDLPPTNEVQAAPLQPEQASTLREPVAQAEGGEARVKIVFTAEEVNEKYLEAGDPTDATPEDKKTSSLRKLLDKAYDLKHNQDPLGELRQKKNEILAFNFKNERPQHE